MSRTAVGIAVVLAAVVGVGVVLLGALTVAIALLVIVVLVAVLTLWSAKTSSGRRAAGVVGARVGRTRLGRRMARAALRSQAERAGIRTVDAAGRPLTDAEIQLALSDTPEARAIQRQLRGLNPQQRAQALRMLNNQIEAQRTGAATPPGATPPIPGARSGSRSSQQRKQVEKRRAARKRR